MVGVAKGHAGRWQRRPGFHRTKKPPEGGSSKLLFVDQAASTMVMGFSFDFT
jgi:hypothetical protein